MENKITQLRKGILELAVLETLESRPHYGYSLIRLLSGNRKIDLTEGTVYPILGRLAREGLVRAEWVESRQGPPRKYYTLTAEGRNVHKVLREEFTRLRELVERAAKEEEDGCDPDPGSVARILEKGEP
jgi:PadR family transcriptional regulator PadR